MTVADYSRCKGVLKNHPAILLQGRLVHYPFKWNHSHAREGGHPICFPSEITKWDPRLRGGDVHT